MFPPPRPSNPFAGDAGSRPPSSDRREQSLSLISTMGKGNNSPMPGYGSSDRSPLTPLGTNGAVGFGTGIRQRRLPNNDTPTSLAGNNNGFPREPIQGPPRWSLSMSMGAAEANALGSAAPVPNEVPPHNDNAIVPRAFDEFWILVFGFSTNQQYDEVLAKFKNLGNVVSIKGVPMVNGSRNWVALSYDSQLTMEKAVGE
ncbi:expressed unknown protein (Partial), partial [Seminavis robusta]|eukprot:Sro1384_g268030.1 n/a (199) ;mRNA; r:2-796